MSKKKTIIVIQQRNTREHKWEDVRCFESHQVRDIDSELSTLRRDHPGITYHVIQRRIRNDEKSQQ